MSKFKDILKVIRSYYKEDMYSVLTEADLKKYYKKNNEELDVYVCYKCGCVKFKYDRWLRIVFYCTGAKKFICERCGSTMVEEKGIWMYREFKKGIFPFRKVYKVHDVFIPDEKESIHTEKDLEPAYNLLNELKGV